MSDQYDEIVNERDALRQQLAEKALEREELTRTFTATIERLERENAAAQTEIERLNNGLTLAGSEIDLAMQQLAAAERRFPCGHRVADWDDSYGECVACKLKQRADDYDRLPHDVIACHDRIEELERERDEARAFLIPIRDELRSQMLCPMCSKMPESR